MTLFDSRERFDAIYQLFARRYPLKQTKLLLNKAEIILFYIEDVDKLLDDLIALGPESEAVKDERLPYWAELWPAAIALSKFLMENPERVSGRPTLELGCGTGLVGITAAMCNAKITISDYQPDALRLSELNWLINLEQSPPSILMDWRAPTIKEKFELIIASDVVYEKRFFNALINVFNQNLTSTGQVILSEPNRIIAQDFFKMLPDEGYCFQKFPVEVEFNDKKYSNHVYIIQRSNSS